MTGMGKPREEQYSVTLLVSSKGKLLSEEWTGNYPGKEVGLAAVATYYEMSGSQEGQPALGGRSSSSAAWYGSQTKGGDSPSGMKTRVQRSQAETERNNLKNKLIEFALKQ